MRYDCRMISLLWLLFPAALAFSSQQEIWIWDENGKLEHRLRSGAEAPERLTLFDGHRFIPAQATTEGYRAPRPQYGVEFFSTKDHAYGDPVMAFDSERNVLFRLTEDDGGGKHIEYWRIGREPFAALTQVGNSQTLQSLCPRGKGPARMVSRKLLRGEDSDGHLFEVVEQLPVLLDFCELDRPAYTVSLKAAAPDRQAQDALERFLRDFESSLEALFDLKPGDYRIRASIGDAAPLDDRQIIEMEQLFEIDAEPKRKLLVPDSPALREFLTPRKP